MIAAASRQEVVQAAAGARTEMHKSRQLANGALEEKRADTFGQKLINIFWAGIGGMAWTSHNRENEFGVNL